MDPVSHAVIGRLVTATRPSPAAVRGLAAASVLGALSPDVDFVLMPIRWDIYLRMHEVGTHSLPGLLATGVASAGLIRLLLRGSRFSLLVPAALAGAVSHVIADIVSGARLRPLWPLVDAPASLPLVAMADPWPIAILLAGALTFWRLRTRRVLVARVVLAALAAFLTVKGALLLPALRALDSAGAAPDAVVEARWASLTGWNAFDRAGDAVRQWRFDASGARPQLVLSWPVTDDTPLVRASRRLDTVRNFLHVHALAFAVTQPAAGLQRAVLWSDIRFCWKPESGVEPIACGLWVGGILEPDGRVVRQQVRVGSWVQDRPAPDGSPSSP